MSDSKEVKVVVSPDAHGKVEIHSLSGKLLDPVPEPKRTNYAFSGNIAAVSTFANFRKPIIDLQQAVAVIDHQDLSITLDTNPNFPDSDKVIGRIELTDELRSFRINNTSNLWSRESLLSFLKVNRQYFPDKAAHAELISALKNFQMKVALEVRNQRDNRGGVNTGITKEVTQENDELPFNTVIELPVFKGEDTKKIALEICFTTSEAQILFWFESDEVNEIQHVVAQERLAAEKEKIEALGILVLEK